MQQATSPGANLTSKGGNSLPPVADQTRFVINLCASTTPVGLVQPSHAGLKRFTFFVSRRREEGRERFRLHMGYFDSQEEAERLLDLVREIYPAAWASVAPGQRLRARAALGESSTAAAPAAPSRAAAAPAATVAPAAARAPVAPAAPPLAAPPRAAPPTPAPAAVAAVAATPASLPARSVNAAPPVPRAAAVSVPSTLAAPGIPTAPSASAPASAPPRVVPSKALLDAAAVHSLSNIRAAIDSLRDQPAEPLAGEQVLSLLEGAPRQIPGSPAAAAPTPAAPTPKAQGAGPATAKATSSAAVPAASVAAAHSATPSAGPYPAGLRPVSAPVPSEVSLFAVQLLWSVQSIDMSQVPQLAIFSAYTLYGAEGNRDGRRWYGLRLGFFTDAVSAKQVAQYVRSEFSAVSVVPVSSRERERASAATAKPAPTPAAAKGSGHELSFIEDTSTNRTLNEQRPAAAAGAAPKGAPPAMPAAGAAPLTAAAPRAASGKRAKLRVAQGTRPVSKRPRHDGPLTLEETLEILGASTLQIDEGRGERLNHAGTPAREPHQPKPRSGSRIGRLMDRLAERFSGG